MTTIDLASAITRAIALTQRAPHYLNSDAGERMSDDAYVEYLSPYLQKTVAAVIAVLPKREIVTLTTTDKYSIADCITTESRSKTDVVQDVFDELAERFEIRSKS